MAETCIVCLGDLAALPAHEDRQLVDAARTTTLEPSKIEHDPNTVAHLLPCGHNLHHECLRPWVERANSCPICRANFNMVELCTYINGPPISSYAVQEKRQEVEVDPSVVVDDELFDDPVWQPCLFCEDDTDEDRLLLCDGCNGSYHTYCVDLRSVPAGPWFCRFCREEGVDDSESRPRRGRPRTRRQQRRQATGLDPQTHEWTRVWQSVWQHTNIDLDFPFHEEEDQEQQYERQNQRELEAISRRLEVAEQNGSAARFRDAANSILAARSRRSRTTTPTPESQEELRAWNAFDKISQLRSDGTPIVAGRKRKSVSASPVEPQPVEPERKLKRPKTRLHVESQDTPAAPRAESSSIAHRRAENAASPPSRSPLPDANGAAPSFLQSLLREVESQPRSSNATPGNVDKDPLSIFVPHRSDSASPLSSPASSPSGSGFTSPRARSASPSGQQSRPSSPPPLSSRIEPIYTKAPQYSPTSPASSDGDTEAITHKASNLPQDPQAASAAATRATSHPRDTSSPPPNITKDDKKEIQTLVTANLKPLYHRKEINSEQYTNINRLISRSLYDRVLKGGGLQSDERERWKCVAAEEVESAVKALNRTVQAR